MRFSCFENLLLQAESFWGALLQREMVCTSSLVRVTGVGLRPEVVTRTRGEVHTISCLLALSASPGREDALCKMCVS